MRLEDVKNVFRRIFGYSITARSPSSPSSSARSPIPSEIKTPTIEQIYVPPEGTSVDPDPLHPTRWIDIATGKADISGGLSNVPNESGGEASGDAIGRERATHALPVPKALLCADALSQELDIEKRNDSSKDSSVGPKNESSKCPADGYTEQDVTAPESEEQANDENNEDSGDECRCAPTSTKNEDGDERETASAWTEHTKLDSGVTSEKEAAHSDIETDALIPTTLFTESQADDSNEQGVSRSSENDDSHVDDTEHDSIADLQSHCDQDTTTETMKCYDPFANLQSDNDKETITETEALIHVTLSPKFPADEQDVSAQATGSNNSQVEGIQQCCSIADFQSGSNKDTTTEAEALIPATLSTGSPTDDNTEQDIIVPESQSDDSWVGGIKDSDDLQTGAETDTTTETEPIIHATLSTECRNNTEQGVSAPTFESGDSQEELIKRYNSIADFLSDINKDTPTETEPLIPTTISTECQDSSEQLMQETGDEEHSIKRYESIADFQSGPDKDAVTEAEPLITATLSTECWDITEQPMQEDSNEGTGHTIKHYNSITDFQMDSVKDTVTEAEPDSKADSIKSYGSIADIKYEAMIPATLSTKGQDSTEQDISAPEKEEATDKDSGDDKMGYDNKRQTASMETEPTRLDNTVSSQELEKVAVKTTCSEKTESTSTDKHNIIATYSPTNANKEKVKSDKCDDPVRVDSFEAVVQNLSFPSTDFYGAPAPHAKGSGDVCILHHLFPSLAIAPPAAKNTPDSQKQVCVRGKVAFHPPLFSENDFNRHVFQKKVCLEYVQINAEMIHGYVRALNTNYVKDVTVHYTKNEGNVVHMRKADWVETVEDGTMDRFVFVIPARQSVGNVSFSVEFNGIHDDNQGQNYTVVYEAIKEEGDSQVDGYESIASFKSESHQDTTTKSLIPDTHFHDSNEQNISAPEKQEATDKDSGDCKVECDGERETSSTETEYTKLDNTVSSQELEKGDVATTCSEVTESYSTDKRDTIATYSPTNANKEEVKSDTSKAESVKRDDPVRVLKSDSFEAVVQNFSFPSTDFYGAPAPHSKGSGDVCILHHLFPSLAIAPPAAKNTPDSQKQVCVRGKVVFHPPLFSENDFNRHVFQKKVCLEYVQINAEMIHGYVRVLNTNYVKDVTVHYTKNEWNVVHMRKAAWVETVEDGTMDRFVFVIPARQSVGNVSFSVEFNGIHDDNQGQNYTVAYEAVKEEEDSQVDGYESIASFKSESHQDTTTESLIPDTHFHDSNEQNISAPEKQEATDKDSGDCKVECNGERETSSTETEHTKLDNTVSSQELEKGDVATTCSEVTESYSTDKHDTIATYSPTNANKEEVKSDTSKAESVKRDDPVRVLKADSFEAVVQNLSFPSTDFYGAPAPHAKGSGDVCILHHLFPSLAIAPPVAKKTPDSQKQVCVRGKVAFHPPLFSEDDFNLRVIQKKVCLEYVQINAEMIHGYVRVLNTNYVKDVTVHYTKNEWNIVHMRKADWVETVEDGTMDRFVFVIPARQSVGNVSFSVEFNGTQDDNQGQNYTVAYEAVKNPENNEDEGKRCELITDLKKTDSDTDTTTKDEYLIPATLSQDSSEQDICASEKQEAADKDDGDYNMVCDVNRKTTSTETEPTELGNSVASQEMAVKSSEVKEHNSTNTHDTTASQLPPVTEKEATKGDKAEDKKRDDYVISKSGETVAQNLSFPSTDFYGAPAPCTKGSGDVCILHHLFPSLAIVPPAAKKASDSQKQVRVRGKVAFHPPLFSEDNFNLHVFQKKMCLEYIQLNADMIHGYVRVLNTTHVKDVMVHYTRNNWKVVHARKADWVETVEDGTMDRFAFVIPASQSVGNVSFLVEFNNMRDDNMGHNYTVSYEAI